MFKMTDGDIEVFKKKIKSQLQHNIPVLSYEEDSDIEEICIIMKYGSFRIIEHHPSRLTYFIRSLDTINQVNLYEELDSDQGKEIFTYVKEMTK